MPRKCWDQSWCHCCSSKNNGHKQHQMIVCHSLRSSSAEIFFARISLAYSMSCAMPKGEKEVANCNKSCNNSIFTQKSNCFVSISSIPKETISSQTFATGDKRQPYIWIIVANGGLPVVLLATMKIFRHIEFFILVVILSQEKQPFLLITKNVWPNIHFDAFFIQLLFLY